MTTDELRSMVDTCEYPEPEQQTGDTHAAIRNLFPSDLSPYWLELKHLAGVLICENVVKNRALEPYFSVAEKIRDSVRIQGSGNPDLQAPDWLQAVKLALRSSESHRSDRFDGSTFRSLYAREFNFSDAVKRMTEVGYSLEQESSVNFPAEERARMLEFISSSIDQIGAHEVCFEVFRALSKSHNRSIDRYLLGRRISQLPSDAREKISQIPYSLLLEICFRRMPSSKKGKTANKEDIADLFSFSADFSAIYDVQPFSQWELLFKNKHSFLGYIRELAIYDNFFLIRQLRPKDLIEFIPILFEWVPPKIEKNLGCTISDLGDVANAILGECAPFGPSILNKSLLRRRLSKMPNGRFLKAMAILTAVCPVGELVTLPEYTKVRASHSYAVIPNIDNNKIVPDKRVSSYSFLTRIMMELYSHDKNTFSYIGNAAETLVKRRLSSMGIKYKSGKYKYPDVEGECDIIIEADDTLIFIEMKIKGFTLAALAGCDVDILVDVTHSLFDAAEQASRHEVTLREKGSLLISQDDGTVYELKLEGRQIEKIALTLDDFGSFQNRTCLRELFPIFVNSQFSPLDKAHKKKLDAINRLASELNRMTHALMRLTQLSSDRLFSKFWFFSVPQLFSAIDGARTSQELANALTKLSRVSFSTMDNYSEIAFAKNLASARGTSPMFHVN